MKTEDFIGVIILIASVLFIMGLFTASKPEKTYPELCWDEAEWFGVESETETLHKPCKQVNMEPCMKGKRNHHYAEGKCYLCPPDETVVKYKKYILVCDVKP